MNPIRPAVYPPPQPGQGPGAVKSAAQRAFFDAALGKATGGATSVPVQTAAAQPPVVHATPVQRMPTGQPTEAPQKILRPGSLLDIRV
ncbi:MAG: hypothetical protein Q7U20_02720 [Caulobacter sp.]|nr:hypothetical protein [Caulobacter sp.]